MRRMADRAVKRIRLVTSAAKAFVESLRHPRFCVKWKVPIVGRMPAARYCSSNVITFVCVALTSVALVCVTAVTRKPL